MSPQKQQNLYTPLAMRQKGGSTKPFSGGVDDIMGSIGKLESGNNYGAMGPATSTGDKAYGKYQVMGANIPSWTKEAMGREYTPDEFLADTDAQDKVARHKMSQSYAKYGNADDVASVWFTGRPVEKAGLEVADVTGTSNADYLQKFRQGLGQSANKYIPLAARQGTRAQAETLTNSSMYKGAEEATAALREPISETLQETVGAPVMNPEKSLEIAEAVTSPGTSFATPALEQAGLPASVALAAGTVGDFASPTGKGKGAKSVISYITKEGKKVFTRLTEKELKVLSDEVKNIPEAKQGFSQIHLDPNNSRLEEVGEEVSKADFIAAHPQVAEVFHAVGGQPRILKGSPGGGRFTAIPPELEPLAVEAKKHKTAEDFTEAVQSLNIQELGINPKTFRDFIFKDVKPGDAAGVIKALTNFYHKATGKSAV